MKLNFMSRIMLADSAGFIFCVGKDSAAARRRCVLGMLSNLEVKVLWPT